MDFENVKAFVDIEIAVQFMIFIMFETRDKICSKIKKSLVSISSMGGKKRLDEWKNDNYFNLFEQ